MAGLDNNENGGSALGKIFAAIGVGLIIILYFIGIIVQFLSKKSTVSAGWGTEVTLENSVSFVPPVAIYKAIANPMGRQFLLVIAGLTIVVLIFIKFGKDKDKNLDERNFRHSESGAYGTSGWMQDYELDNLLDVKSIQDTDGTILGINNKGKVVSLPMTSGLNKHTAIYGASGTGKSTTFVIPQILQCCRRNESIIVTDPKGEIYAKTSKYLKDRGYQVKVFNLVEPQYSDSWNCLGEITRDESQVELMAQTFCDVIIKNTSGPSPDHFWDNSEMSLLKALCLYVALDKNRPEQKRNIGAVYELLTENDDLKLTAMFDRLDIGHPARAPWNIYKKAGDTVRGNIIIGLGSRLQVFQADIIKRITQYNEIDLETPAREKCVYYVIMSDQESTLNFLSSLFFSFLFIKLVKYADIKGKDGKCDVPVNFILDEFPNIGQIPDFTKKLSTIRSRDLRVSVIFQNLAQLQNRYPLGQWEEIIGNCDTHLFLGCTDPTTAEFISSRTGEITIEVGSTAVQRQSISVAETIPQYRETKSVGKRFLLTPDEVMRFDSDKALVILRGQKVLKVNKFYYFKYHPERDKLITTMVRDHTPEWRVDHNTPTKSMVDKIDVQVNTDSLPTNDIILPNLQDNYGPHHGSVETNVYNDEVEQNKNTDTIKDDIGDENSTLDNKKENNNRSKSNARKIMSIDGGMISDAGFKHSADPYKF